MRTAGHLAGAIILILALVAVGAFVYAAANPSEATGGTSLVAAAEAAAAAAAEAPAAVSAAETTTETAAETAAETAGDATAATASIKDTLTPEVMMSYFKPLPTEMEAGDYQVTNELTHLGRMLFYDPRLSINQQMSCNTCHLLNDYGVDGLTTSLGHDGKPVSRNAPTVYNAAFHIAQFWDGRAEGVEEQAGGPMLAAAEMGMPDEAYVENVVNSIPGYEQYFVAAFGNENPVNFENIKTAIGAFERRLVTPSRVDSYMLGDLSALTEEELQGAQTFVSVGCIGCHNGMGFGGLMYGKLGQAVPYEVEDAGRAAVTGVETDEQVFKVPSLRNVTETGPYLHDGSIETIEEMVALMGKYQLARDLTTEEINSIVTFLGALKGDLPEQYIAVPVLPESGPETASFAQTQTME
jgi:cytochrome c peroxidase